MCDVLFQVSDSSGQMKTMSLRKAAKKTGLEELSNFIKARRDSHQQVEEQAEEQVQKGVEEQDVVDGTDNRSEEESQKSEKDGEQNKED